MQLKKKFSSARRTIAVSALTAAMLVTSMPAFASDGLHLGGNAHLSFGDDVKGLLKDIKNEIKGDAKADKKASREDRESNSGATNSASATAAVSCRTDAEKAHREALAAPQAERDASVKSAHDVLMAALKSAQATYHAQVAASASNTGVIATIEARIALRKSYSDAVRAAQRIFSDAKRAAASTYRDEVRAANDAYHRARLACRVSTQQ